MTNDDLYSVEEIQSLGREFDALDPLFSAMLSDIRELSKKKPDGIMNPRKIDTVNRILTDLLRILDREPSRAYLDMIDRDDVPQYSDVALMLGQVAAAMASFKSKYYQSGFDFGPYRWVPFDANEEYEDDDYEDEPESADGGL